MKTSDAITKVAELRAKGYSYTQVARELGFSKQRVGQIVAATRKAAEWDHGLSRRNRAVLRSLNISDRFGAMLAIDDGRIAPYKFSNYGKTSYASLCQWLGVPVKVQPKTIHCPKCQHQITIS